MNSSVRVPAGRPLSAPVSPLRGLCARLAPWALVFLVSSQAACLHPGQGPIPASLKRQPTQKISPAVLALEEIAYRDGDLMQAEQRARALLGRDPDLAVAHEILGWIMMLKGDDKASRRHFQGALLDGREPGGTLYLRAMSDRDDDRETIKSNIEALYAVMEHHPNLHLRATAAHYLSRHLRRQGELERAAAVLSRRGMIGPWAVIGGFDNDQHRGFPKVYAPEEQIDLKGYYKSSQGWPVRWRALPQVDHLGLLNLEQIMSPSTWNVAYLVTYVRSERAAEAVLHLSTTDAFRVWSNDALLASQEDKKRYRADDVRIKITLNRGWNKLLIKSAQRKDRWVVGARFSTPAGLSLTGLTYSATPQVYAKAAAPAHLWSMAKNLESFLPRTASPARRSFLLAYLASASGDTPLSTQLYDVLADKTPSSPLFWYFGGLAYWDDRQDNKAANYLRRGTEKYKDIFSLFPAKRARWFNQRKQWRAATRHLKAALATSPKRAHWKLALAQQYRKKGWYEEELTLLDQVVREHPGLIWGHQARGDCLRSLGRLQRAKGDYQAALAIDRSSTKIRLRLAALAARKGDWPRAIKLARESIALEPTSPGRRVELGDLYRKSGRFADAERSYCRASELDPQWAKPYRLRGALASERGQQQRATALWHKALVFDPDNSNLWERTENLAPSTEFVLPQYLLSEEQVLAELGRTAGVTHHPESSSLWLIDEEASQWLADGTSRSVVTVAVRVLDERARRALGKVFLRPRGYLQLNFAFVLGPEGERTDVSSLHSRSLIFPKLKVNSTIVYQYVHHESNTGFQSNERSATWFFQQTTGHVRRSRYTLITERDAPFHLHLQGEIKRREQFIQHGKSTLRVNTFNARDVPPLLPDEQSRNPRIYLAKVVVSTVKDWESFVQWDRGMTMQAIKLTPEIKGLALRLAPADRSPAERVRAIYRFVVQKIRYQQDYAFKIDGVKPHLSSMVLQRRYGDCKDKTVLLMSLLEAIGVGSRYALVLTTGKGEVYPEVPAQQFNHVIVYVPAQRGIPRPRFLDATAEFLDLDNVRSDDQGALALVVDKTAHEFIRIPFQPAERSVVRLEVDLDLSPKDRAGAGTFSYRATGVTASMMRRMAANRGAVKKGVRGIFGVMFYEDGAVSDHEVGDPNNLDRPFVLKGAFQSPGMVQWSEAGVQVRMPSLLSRFRYGKWEKRNLPLFLQVKNRVEVRLKVRLAADTRASFKDKKGAGSYRVQHPCLDFSEETTQEGQVVTRTQRLSFTCEAVTPEDYPRFKEAWDNIIRRATQPLILTRGSSPKNKRGL